MHESDNSERQLRETVYTGGLFEQPKAWIDSAGGGGSQSPSSNNCSPNSVFDLQHIPLVPTESLRMSVVIQASPLQGPVLRPAKPTQTKAGANQNHSRE